MSAVSNVATMRSEAPAFADMAKQLLIGFVPLAVVLFVLPWIMDFLPSMSDYQMLQDVGIIAADFDVSTLTWLSLALACASFAHMVPRFIRSCACLASGAARLALESRALFVMERVLYWAGLLVLVMAFAFHVSCQAIMAHAAAESGVSEIGYFALQTSDYSSTWAWFLFVSTAILVIYGIAALICKRNKGNDNFGFLQEAPLLTWFLLAVIIPCTFFLSLGVLIAVLKLIGLLFVGALYVFGALIALRIGLFLLAHIRIHI